MLCVCWIQVCFFVGGLRFILSKATGYDLYLCLRNTSSVPAVVSFLPAFHTEKWKSGCYRSAMMFPINKAIARHVHKNDLLLHFSLLSPLMSRMTAGCFICLLSCRCDAISFVFSVVPFRCRKWLSAKCVTMQKPFVLCNEQTQGWSYST